MILFVCFVIAGRHSEGRAQCGLHDSDVTAESGAGESRAPGPVHDWRGLPHGQGAPCGGHQGESHRC